MSASFGPDLVRGWLVPPLPPPGVALEEVTEAGVVFSVVEPVELRPPPRFPVAGGPKRAEVWLPRRACALRAAGQPGVAIDWVQALLCAYAMHPARGREARTLGEIAYGRAQRDHVRGVLSRMQLDAAAAEERLQGIMARYSEIISDRRDRRGLWANEDTRPRLLALEGLEVERIEVRIEREIAAGIQRAAESATQALAAALPVAQVAARTSKRAFRKALKLTGLVGGKRTLGGAPLLPTLGDEAEALSTADLYFVRERLPTPRTLERALGGGIRACARPVRRHAAVGRRRMGAPTAPVALAVTVPVARDRCVRDEGCVLPSTLGWPESVLVQEEAARLEDAAARQCRACPRGAAGLRALLRSTTGTLAPSVRGAGPLGLAALVARQLRADEAAGRSPAGAAFSILAALANASGLEGVATAAGVAAAHAQLPALAAAAHVAVAGDSRGAAVTRRSLEVLLAVLYWARDAAPRLVIQVLPPLLAALPEGALALTDRLPERAGTMPAVRAVVPALWWYATRLVPAGLGVLFLQASYFDGAMVAAIDSTAPAESRERLAVGDIITHVDGHVVGHMGVERILAGLRWGPVQVTVLREVEFEPPDGAEEAVAATVHAAVPVELALTALPTARTPHRVRAVDAEWLAFEVSRGIAREVCEAKFVTPMGSRCALQYFDVCWRLCSPQAWQMLNASVLRGGAQAHVAVRPHGGGVRVGIAARLALPGLFEALVSFGVPAEGVSLLVRQPEDCATAGTCRCAAHTEHVHTHMHAPSTSPASTRLYQQQYPRTHSS